MNFGSGAMGGLFGTYNKVMKYRNLKNQELAERANLSDRLNQANNNLDITREQAPLVPQQAAEGFAARGVAQSTFGSGLGDKWGAGVTPPQTFQNSAGQATTAQGQPIGPNGLPADWSTTQAQGASKYRQADITNTTPAQTSGENQPIGTGLQRARDLATAMVSNASSSQDAARTALDRYEKTMKNNRRMFYADMASQYLGMIFGMMGM